MMINIDNARECGTQCNDGDGVQNEVQFIGELLPRYVGLHYPCSNVLGRAIKDSWDSNVIECSGR